MTIESPFLKRDMWFTGEDQNLEWDVRDDSGTPVDITGWTIQFRMSLIAGGASVLTKAATQILTARCQVNVAAADTSSLAARTYFYTVSRTDTGLNQVLAYGDALLQARVL